MRIAECGVKQDITPQSFIERKFQFRFDGKFSEKTVFSSFFGQPLFSLSIYGGTR
jgi:hypothetical protein